MAKSKRGSKAVKKAPVHEEKGQFELSKGPEREYVKKVPRPDLVKMSKPEKLQLAGLIALAAAIRLYRINRPSSVVFDETLEGNAINNYNNHAFFIGTDPPDAGLIYTWLANAYGYIDSAFQFSVGREYIDEKTGKQLFPYLALRVFSALCSSSMTLFLYRTAKASGVRHWIALFGALISVFENSFVIHSRYFFSETPLLFFLSFAVAMYKTSQSYTPLSRKWISCVLVSGIAAGYALSSKTAGVLVVLWLILINIKEFWFYAGDIKVTTAALVKYASTGFVAFLIIPVVVYIFFFAVHIKLLTDVGPSYGIMSPEFQHGLNGNHLEGLVSDVSYGSQIRIRQVYSGSYIQTLNATYRNGHQQAVLENSYEDPNNVFYLERIAEGNQKDSLQYANGEDSFRLYNNQTKTYLRIDPGAKPPLSEQEYNREVTALGNETWEGDNYTKFQFKILGELCKSRDSQLGIQAVNTVFQIYNQERNCYLLGTRKRLPQDWGFNRNEMICIEQPTMPRSVWYIDYNTHPLYTEQNKKVEFVKLPLWAKILEVNNAMFYNIKEHIGEHRFSAKAKEWPLAKRGIPYYVGDNKEVYFLGNLIAYYLVVFVIGLYVAIALAYIVTWNPYTTSEFNERTYIYLYNGFDYLAGYLISWVPYLEAEQTLFTFQYLPALYFGILLIAQTFEFIVSKRTKPGYIFLIIWAVGIVVTFARFSRLIYGIEWTQDACRDLLLMPGWDSFCAAFK